MFISELENRLILHIVDVETSFTVSVIVESRSFLYPQSHSKSTGVTFTDLLGVVGRSKVFREDFVDLLNYLGIKQEVIPARRHNKTGEVENKNAVLRLLVQRILKEAMFLQERHGIYIDHVYLVSRAS